MKIEAIMELITLAERLTPNWWIGDGMVAQFHEAATAARLELPSLYGMVLGNPAMGRGPSFAPVKITDVRYFRGGECVKPCRCSKCAGKPPVEGVRVALCPQCGRDRNVAPDPTHDSGELPRAPMEKTA